MDTKLFSFLKLSLNSYLKLFMHLSGDTINLNIPHNHTPYSELIAWHSGKTAFVLLCRVAEWQGEMLLFQLSEEGTETFSPADRAELEVTWKQY